MKRAFLLDQVRGQWSPEELIKNARRFYEKHHKAASPMGYMAVEEAAAGVTLIMELRKRGIPARGIVRVKDKVTRVMDVLPFQATVMVWLPKGAPWLPGFELELAQFRKDGRSTKDDQVDAFADGVQLILGKGTSILNVLGSARPGRAA
jgi:predicted phage terminase large subunit-like protein